ncbi:MAG: alpha-1,6-glucosidase domain-containing protein, partial [Propioniciclava sp.]
ALPVATDPGQRARATLVALALATLGQNPVLWHAGVDLLRSKSLDRNSYDSGDWFNRLDYTGRDNGFGRGLPPARDNETHWRWVAPLLADPALRPDAGLVGATHARALDLLRLRSSSRLFRLGSAAQIEAKLTFPASGTWAQRPGVVVMFLDDERGTRVDSRFAGVLVVANALPWPAEQPLPAEVGTSWTLHPVQAHGADDVVRRARVEDGIARVPSRTVAVFVRLRP